MASTLKTVTTRMLDDGDIGLSDDELLALPTGVLETLSTLLAGVEEELKRRKDRLHKVMMSRFGQGLMPGTHWTDSQGQKVKIEVPKQVEWSQDGLKLIAEHIRTKFREDPKDYIDFKLFIPENRYKGWPGAIQAMFEPARTVSTGKPRFSFHKPEDL